MSGTEALIERIGQGTASKDEVRCIVIGLNRTEVASRLGCPWWELRRWRDDGRFPKPDGIAPNTVWRGGFTWVEVWLPETVDAVKPQLEGWRYEDKEQRAQKARRKVKAVA